MRISITQQDKERIVRKELERLFKELMKKGDKEKANKVYCTICMISWMYDNEREIESLF